MQNSTRCVFFLTGLVFALWSCLVPGVKDHARLDDGGLGLMLLCLGVGSLLGMPLAGMMVARYGCRIVALSGLGMACIALLPLSFLGDLRMLPVCLFLFGGGLGAVETAINIQAVAVEERGRTPMLSNFHAFFSIGGAVGAAGFPALIALGLPPSMAIVPGQVVIGISMALAARGLLARRLTEGKTAQGLVMPSGLVWLLGLLTCFAFLAEGAVLDWGGVYLSTQPRIVPLQSGWGYSVFSFAMTAARLAGDRAILRLGRDRMLLLGGLGAALGFGFLVFAPGTLFVPAGFLLIGLGCANIVPILYTLAGRQTAMSAHAAVSAMTTMGYAGILAGPPLIGALAMGISLPAAFLLLSLLMIAIAASFCLAR
ncbi:major facilitator superfamily transporter [Swaminathania salitolerans LMG 21291]|uniref:Putative MFS-type transporter n=1 Tax=Swaminathania salitolerans TaxID=182838 RepID=A0A511BR22_9PROT|nr:major facilitator superfamily transporter [Swaminathania salitolerans LMG 21291]GEL02715.1 putative MFS-type transporter [Swaminathania salitolerans]